MSNKKVMKKEVNHAFGKDIYLLGKDENNRKYWLEAPSWDCDWYWGFGYVETYTNNKNPSIAKDIATHEHIDTSFLGKQGYEYIHNLYDSPLLQETTFTMEEGWQLGELFKQFYLLQKMAEFTHREKPNCGITSSPIEHGDLKLWNKDINEKMIPAITSKIMEILTPVDKKKEHYND